MQEYASKADFMAEIQKTAALFIGEFDAIIDEQGTVFVEGVDRSPAQMVAYQLGWMALIRGWDADECAGKAVAMPAPGYKWNCLGGLYQRFYDDCGGLPLSALKARFTDEVAALVQWVAGFSDEALFTPGGRKWAASTPSNWPVWKWVHINTVAPFKSFRSQIRKWKKLGL